MEFESSQRELLDHSFFFFLCLGLLVLTNNNQTFSRFFDIKRLSVLPASLVNTWRKIVDIFCSSRCWMYQGFQRWPADLSQYTTQKRESKFRGKTEPKFNTCIQPFLVFVFVAQNEILHAMERVYHWALFLPLLIFRSIFINQWFQQLP